MEAPDSLRLFPLFLRTNLLVARTESSSSFLPVCNFIFERHLFGSNPPFCKKKCCQYCAPFVCPNNNHFRNNGLCLHSSTKSSVDIPRCWLLEDVVVPIQICANKYSYAKINSTKFSLLDDASGRRFLASLK